MSTSNQADTKTGHTPRVFVSYSHDNPEHKAWVAKLAGQLREKGIDTVLDQWDMSLGGDLGQFMEKGVSLADRVLVICTPSYCRKANDGTGGVGYEKTIVTQDLMRDATTDKFVPIIRVADDNPSDVVPTCLGSRLFIDMREDSEDAFSQLLADLHRQPAQNKPPLGKSPFAVTATGATAVVADSTILLPTTAADLDPGAVYRQAIETIRRGDAIAWRHLARDVRIKSLSALTASREAMDHLLQSNAARTTKEMPEVINLGADAVAPMFAMAFAGIESGRPDLENQISVLDEVINVANWNQAGYTVISDLPVTLGFLYHYLHGAMCMQMGRLDLAMGFARSTIKPLRERHRSEVRGHLSLTGWTGAFQSNVSESWQYLRDWIKGQAWIAEVFGTTQDALSALAAYCYALTVDELGSTVSSCLRNDGQWWPTPHAFDDYKWPAVPFFFLLNDEPAPERGYQLFLRNLDHIPDIWRRWSVPDHLMPVAWEAWVNFSAVWLTKFNFHTMRFTPPSQLPHAHLMLDTGITREQPFQEERR